MFDKEAIEALQYGGGIHEASDAVRTAFAETQLVGLPNHFTLHDLEKFLPNRRRARGSMVTSSARDFAIYVSKHKEPGAAVFINKDEMNARAVLNVGSPAAPGHADNTATYSPDRTAAYDALRSIADGIGKTQLRVAEFLEDWGGLIQCFAGPGGAEEIPVGRAVGSIRKITIESLKKLESEEQSLSATRSSFERVQAVNAETIPVVVYFKCHPYHALPERTFVMRLGILTSGDKPAVNLRIVKFEQHQEEMAQELAALVASNIGTHYAKGDVDVLLGQYSANVSS